MRIWLLILMIYLSAVPVWGSAEEYPKEEKEVTEEDTIHITEELMAGLELEELNQLVQEMLGNPDQSFSDMVWNLLSGSTELDASGLFSLLGEIFYQELLEQKEILLQLFLLILAAAVLFNLTHLFENGQMTDVTFYMVYLMVFVLLMRSFSGLLGQVSSVVELASSFMKVLTPAYFLAITAASGSMSASVYYQIVLIVVTLIQDVLLKVGIPAIQVYVVLGIVNYLSQEDFLSKMAELIKIGVDWLIKSVTALIVGLQVIQKMVAPALDLVKRGFVGKTASVIPGLGNILDSVTELTLGCAVLVRNCLGAAALIVLILFGLGPVVQLGVTTLLYRLVAAVIQPVSEKRLVRAMVIMAEGCGMLLRVLITAEIMFLLTIAIAASGGLQ